MDPVQNRYCERLGIPIPCVEDVAEQGIEPVYPLSSPVTNPPQRIVSQLLKVHAL